MDINANEIICIISIKYLTFIIFKYTIYVINLQKFMNNLYYRNGEDINGYIG